MSFPLAVNKTSSMLNCPTVSSDIYLQSISHPNISNRFLSINKYASLLVLLMGSLGILAPYMFGSVVVQSCRATNCCTWSPVSAHRIQRRTFYTVLVYTRFPICASSLLLRLSIEYVVRSMGSGGHALIGYSHWLQPERTKTDHTYILGANAKIQTKVFN